MNEFESTGDHDIPPPTKRDLVVFPELGDAWEDLGRSLSFDEQTLQLIKQNSSTPVKRQKQLFRTYLKISSRPSWRVLVNALYRIGKRDVAVKVVDEFQLPRELLRPANNRTSWIDSGFYSSLEITSDTSQIPVRAQPHDQVVSGPNAKNNANSATLISDKQRPQTAQIPVVIRAKPCAVADGGAGSSPLSFQSRNHDLKFNQSKSKTSQVHVRTPRVVADGGGEQSPQSLQSFDYESDDSKFSGSKSMTSQVQVNIKPRVEADGGSPSPSSSLEDTKFDKKRPWTTRVSLKPEPVVSSGPRVKDYDSALVEGVDVYFKSEGERSLEGDGLSSGDYHSAEDVPLDDRNYSNELTSIESPQNSINAEVLSNINQDERKAYNKRLMKGAILNRNIEAIYQCVGEMVDMLNEHLEVRTTLLHKCLNSTW